MKISKKKHAFEHFEHVIGLLESDNQTSINCVQILQEYFGQIVERMVYSKVKIRFRKHTINDQLSKTTFSTRKRKL